MVAATKGVVFLAVPHFGSDMAKHVNRETIRTLTKAHPALGDLCAHTGRLEQLNTAFKQLPLPNCLSIGEAQPAPLGMGIKALVVGPASANPGFGAFVVLPGSDHMTICKANTKQDPVYTLIRTYLLAAVNGTNN